MISVEEAIARILAAVQPLPQVHVPLSAAVHRFAAQDHFSPIDLPPFDNSAMDGYAVRAQDLRNAAPENKVALHLRARLAAGEPAEHEVSRGECIRVFTGSQMPPEADAVVMQEDVTVDGSTIFFSEPARPLENVRLRGEDVKKGSLVISAGHEINAAHVALLGAAGFKEISVHQLANVALLATGNEIREPGQPLGAGEIYESNRQMLAALLTDQKTQAQVQPIVPDSLDATITALKDSFAQSDLVISTGGVSVGEYDFVKEAFQRLGGTLELWRIAMRPGKPFVFGRLGQKLLFGLPGNPVSAFVTFLIFVRPALLKMHGAAVTSLPRIRGQLAEPIANRGDRRHFARVRWHAGQIHLAGPQKSHMLGSLGQSNALLDLPPGTNCPAGTHTEVLLWNPRLN